MLLKGNKQQIKQIKTSTPTTQGRVVRSLLVDGRIVEHTSSSIIIVIIDVKERTNGRTDVRLLPCDERHNGDGDEAIRTLVCAGLRLCKSGSGRNRNLGWMSRATHTFCAGKKSALDNVVVPEYSSVLECCVVKNECRRRSATRMGGCTATVYTMPTSK